MRPSSRAGHRRLTSAATANAYLGAVRRRFVELLFDANEEAERDLAFNIKQTAEATKKQLQEITCCSRPRSRNTDSSARRVRRAEDESPSFLGDGRSCDRPRDNAYSPRACIVAPQQPSVRPSDDSGTRFIWTVECRAEGGSFPCERADSEDHELVDVDPQHYRLRLPPEPLQNCRLAAKRCLVRRQPHRDCCTEPQQCRRIAP
jgi:hypothetical protein